MLLYRGKILVPLQACPVIVKYHRQLNWIQINWIWAHVPLLIMVEYFCVHSSMLSFGEPNSAVSSSVCIWICWFELRTVFYMCRYNMSIYYCYYLFSCLRQSLGQNGARFMWRRASFIPVKRWTALSSKSRYDGQDHRFLSRDNNFFQPVL